MSIIDRSGHLIAALQSIVPEVDEDEHEEQEGMFPTTFLHPEEPQKTLKRKRSLVELVLVSAPQRTGSHN
jgi:hypothetical protein